MNFFQIYLSFFYFKSKGHQLGGLCLEIQTFFVFHEVLKQLPTSRSQNFLACFNSVFPSQSCIPEILISASCFVLPPAFAVCRKIICTLDECMELLIAIFFEHYLFQGIGHIPRKNIIHVFLNHHVFVLFGSLSEAFHPVLNGGRNVFSPAFSDIMENSHEEHSGCQLFIFHVLLQRHVVGKHCSVKQVPQYRALHIVHVHSPPVLVTELGKVLDNLEHMMLRVGRKLLYHGNIFIFLQGFDDFMVLMNEITIHLSR